MTGPHPVVPAGPQVIVFASPAIGTGRTGTVATAAAVLAAAEKRVLLVDACPGGIRLHDYLRPFYLEPSAGSVTDGDVVPVTDDRLRELADAAATSPDFRPGLGHSQFRAEYNLPMGLGELSVIRALLDPADRSAGAAGFGAQVRRLPFDYVLVDAPPRMTAPMARLVSELADVVVLCYLPRQRSEAAAFLGALRDGPGGAELPVVAVPTVPSAEVDPRWSEPPAPLDKEAGGTPVPTVQLAIRGYQLQGLDQVLPLYVEDTSGLTTYREIVAAVTRGAVAALPEISPVVRARYRRGHHFPTDRVRDVVTLFYATADRPWADWLRAELRRGRIDVRDFVPGERPAGHTRCVISSAQLRTSAPTMAFLNEMVADTAEPVDLVWIKVDDDGPPPAGRPRAIIDLASAPMSTPASRISTSFGIVSPAERRHDQPRLPAPPEHQIQNLPPRNPAFVGRTEHLMELRDRLLDDLGHRATFSGAPGVGKSELVVEYAYRFLYDYDVVWWISAQDTQSVLAALTALAVRLHLPDVGDAPRAVLAALAAPDAQRSLLIYDNADDLGILAGLVPAGDAAHVLITTRNPDPASRPTDVDVFSAEESVRLLTDRVPGLPDATAGLIAEAVDRLPLALRLVSAWLRESTASLRRTRVFTEQRAAAVLAQELRDRLGRPAEDFDEEHLPSRQLRGVARALSIVLSTMRAEDLFITVRLAELSAFLSSDGTSLSLLRSRPMLRLLAQPRRAVEPGGAERPSPLALDESYIDAVLWAGTRFGLFEVDWGARGQMQIHRAVQELLQGAMNGEREGRREQVQRALAEYAPTDPQVEEAAFAAPLEELQRHFVQCGALHAPDDAVRHWVTKQIRYLYRLRDRATWEAALALAQRARATWREAGIAEEDPLSCRLLVQIANLHRALGDNVAAERLDQQVLEADPSAETDPTLASLRARRGLAGDLRGQGRFGEALQEDREVQDGLRSLLGAEHRDTLMSRHNLALSTFLNGQPLRALQIEQEVYETYLRLMGRSELRVWRSIADIGMYQRELGRFTDSLATLQEAEQGIRQVRGLDNRNHVDVLRIRRSIEVTERCLARPGFSAARLAEVTRSYADVLGEDHPDVRACRLSLAAAYRVTGEVAAAVDTAERCLAEYARDLDPAHPFLAACQVNLSAYHRQSPGGIERALGLAWRGHEILVRIRASHPWSLAAAVNLAVCQIAAGQADEAEGLLARTFTTARDRLTPTHPYTVAARANLDLLRSPGGMAPQDWVTLDIDVPQT